MKLSILEFKQWVFDNKPKLFYFNSCDQRGLFKNLVICNKYNGVRISLSPNTITLTGDDGYLVLQNVTHIKHTGIGCFDIICGVKDKKKYTIVTTIDKTID